MKGFYENPFPKFEKPFPIFSLNYDKDLSVFHNHKKSLKFPKIASFPRLLTSLFLLNCPKPQTRELGLAIHPPPRPLPWYRINGFCVSGLRKLTQPITCAPSFLVLQLLETKQRCYLTNCPTGNLFFLRSSLTPDRKLSFYRVGSRFFTHRARARRGKLLLNLLVFLLVFLFSCWRGGKKIPAW